MLASGRLPLTINEVEWALSRRFSGEYSVELPEKLALATVASNSNDLEIILRQLPPEVIVALGVSDLLSRIAVVRAINLDVN